jgi:hypothetical protein
MIKGIVRVNIHNWTELTLNILESQFPGFYDLFLGFDFFDFEKVVFLIDLNEFDFLIDSVDLGKE